MYFISHLSIPPFEAVDVILHLSFSSRIFSSSRHGLMKNDVVNEWSCDLNTDDAIKELSGAFKTKRDAQQLLAEASFILYIHKRCNRSYNVL